MKGICVLGSVYSGKGEQTKRLCKKLEARGEQVVLIGTGDIFRKLKEEDNYLSYCLKNVDGGGLVPDPFPTFVVMEKIISCIKEHSLESAKEIIFVFDGFPRDRIQLADLMAIFSGLKFSKVKGIYLKVEEEEILKRFEIRSKTSGRKDDCDERKAWKRMGIFEEVTNPVIDDFRLNRSFDFVEIDGNRSIDEIHEEIMSGVENF